MNNIQVFLKEGEGIIEIMIKRKFKQYNVEKYKRKNLKFKHQQEFAVIRFRLGKQKITILKRSVIDMFMTQL
ncbi:unnamed protein product [Paramecium primaurelia]|uniref:Uncharacterized protein n=1 Tax=Paramecium primaurelia TaxID=5886 RepID=A0A8S1LBJ5_PARPR|nr:unnamed protein product [Paramecium primaurelia]